MCVVNECILLNKLADRPQAPVFQFAHVKMSARFIVLRPPQKNVARCLHVFLLSFCLFSSTLELWITADVRFSAFILEVDLRQIERRAEQVIGSQFYTRACRRADGQPVKPERIATGNPILGVKRQELRQSFFLASIQHVALKFRDDEREARNLGREVAQLDPAKVREGNF
jgi:hypothetical protein